MNNRISSNVKAPCATTKQNQRGSIILIVLMLLVIMSIIGIGSTNTTITESFIVRNSSIRKQNLHMADAVVAEALQEVLDAGFSSDLPASIDLFLTQDQITPLSSTVVNWVHHQATWSWTNWYDPNFAGRVLNVNNSQAPSALREDEESGVALILDERGEWDMDIVDDPDNSPIRYALVGWSVVDDTNLDITGDKQRRSASILTEYVSERYGILRMIIGIQRIFQL